MKFSQEILINLPREEVIIIIQDPSNFRHWQRGLISHKHLTGLPGKEGSRSRVKYNMNGREIEMIETIIKINSPKKFYATYEPKVYSIFKKITLKGLKRIKHGGLQIVNFSLRDL